MSKGKTKEPKTIRSPINTPMLNYKVYYMSPFEKMTFGVLLFLAGGAAGYVFYGGLFMEDGEPTLATLISNVVVICTVGIVANIALFPAVRSWLKDRRDRALQAQFKDLLESLATSLSSGNTVSDSFANAYKDLQNQYNQDAYIIQELKEILDGMTNGKTLEEMLVFFGSRTNSEDIQNFANVISNCFRLGTDFRIAVCTCRDIISDKNAIEEEINTKLTSNKLQLNVMCTMPVILVAMLKSTNGDFAQNLGSPTGLVVTTFAIGLFLLAYYWGQKIIDVR